MSEGPSYLTILDESFVSFFRRGSKTEWLTLNTKTGSAITFSEVKPEAMAFREYVLRVATIAELYRPRLPERFCIACSVALSPSTTARTLLMNMVSSR